MHTKTSKQVLAPLAEAVSALIVIISDAEINSTPTPNLSELSKAVDAQVLNLLNVANKITTQPSADKKLKDDMPQACEKVKHASSLLVSSTEELAQDPISSAGRNHLLEAVKGILSGTTRILDVFDDSEVRRILAASSILRQLLAQIKRGPSAIPQKEYIQFISQASQTIVALAQLASKRVSELLSNSLQLQLQDAIKILTKESPLLVSACKLILMQPKSQDVQDTLDGLCGRLEKTSLRIDEIVLCHEVELPDKSSTANPAGVSVSFGSKGNNLSNARRQAADLILAETFGEAYKDNPEKTVEAHKKFVELSRENLKEIQAMVNSITDPVLKAKAQQLIDSASKNLDELEKAIEAAQANPDDPKLNHDIRALARAINQTFDTLDTAVNRGLIGDLITVLGDLTDLNRPGTAVTDLSVAGKNNDSAGMVDSTKRFDVANEKLETLVGHATTCLEDTTPQLAREVAQQNSRVAELTPAVKLASKILAANPSDAMALEYLNNVLGSYVESTKDMQKLLVTQEGVFAPEDLVYGAKSAFEQHTEALKQAIANGDAEAMQREYIMTETAASQFLSIAEKEKEFSEDPAYKLDLDLKLKVVQTVLPGLLSTAKAFLTGKSSPESPRFGEVTQIVENMAAQFAAVGASIVTYKGGKPEDIAVPEVVVYEAPTPQDPVDFLEEKINVLALTEKLLADPERQEQIAKVLNRGEDEHLRALTSAVTDIVIVDEAAPRKLSTTEAESDPLKAAGQELKVEASYWNAEENPIIMAVTEMSNRMLELSSQHSILSANGRDAAAKKAFIDAAQAILKQASSLVESANPLLEVCTDKRLRAQLQGTLSRVSTLAQQLKIVAAVKASAPSDSDKGVQLVTCAQNLMQSVKKALRDCVSCTLRVRKDLPASSAALKFKKVIYARDVLAAGIDLK